mgnify:CR=1 FL=1
MTYGYSRPDELTEFVNLRLAGVGRLPKPQPQPAELAGAGVRPAPYAERPVYFAGGWRTTPIYARAGLAPGQRLRGPAIVEQLDSTTLILPDEDARVDALGNLIVSV